MEKEANSKILKFNIIEYYSDMTRIVCFGKKFVFFRDVITGFEIIIYIFNSACQSGFIDSQSMMAIYKFTKFIQFQALNDTSPDSYFIVQCIFACFLILNSILFLIITHQQFRSFNFIKLDTVCYYANHVIFIFLIPIFELMMKNILMMSHFKNGASFVDCINILATILMIITLSHHCYFFRSSIFEDHLLPHLIIETLFLSCIVPYWQAQLLLRLTIES
jgi:hypothetical protein